jgi:hypothetical protein
MLVRDDDGKVLNVLLFDFDYASTLEVVEDRSALADRFRTVGLFPFALRPLIYPLTENTTIYGHRDFAGKR